MFLGILMLSLLPAMGQEPAVAPNGQAIGFEIEAPESWVTQADFTVDGIGVLYCVPEGDTTRVLMVTVSAAGGVADDAAEKARDSVLTQVEDMKEIRGAKALDRTIDGVSAFGFEVEQDEQGTTFLARRFYLLHDERLYSVQYHAPKEGFAELEEGFEQSVDSMRFTELGEEGDALLHLRALGRRCGTQAPWVSDWEEASRRAKEEDKAILVVVRATSGFEVADPISRGPFMDPEVLALLDRRFLVMAWEKGMETPFVDHAVFGLSSTTFGDGILLTDAGGNVLEQLFLLETTAVYDALLAAVQEEAAFPAGPPVPDGMSDLELATFHFECGRPHVALALIESQPTPQSPDWPALEARIHFALRDATACRAALDRARETMKTMESMRSTTDDLDLLEAQLLAAIGEADAAEEVVARVLARGESVADPERALALVVSGSLHLQAGDKESAEARFHETIEDHPEIPWSWLVASYLSHPAWELDLEPDLRWPRAEDRRFWMTPKASAEPEAPIPDQIRTAIAFLLSEQLEEGSWPAMTSYGDRTDLADDFELAATAIVGHALLRCEEDEKAKSAAGRALSWMLYQRALRDAEEDDPIVFMDYSVWSRSYMLRFLDACLTYDLGDSAEVHEEIRRCLLDLHAVQKDNGGWSYLVSGSIDGPAMQQAISFTTATVLLALERIDSRGLLRPVEREMYARGLDALEHMRSPEEGTFAYFLHGADATDGVRASSGVEGSAARGPVCGLALWRGEREQVEDLVPRFELYLAHLAPFGAERRKALMHAGLHGQGSHYLLYDYSTAAEALHALRDAGAVAPDLEERIRRAILRELGACRNVDGSYVDNPLIGVHSGTGLALHALLDLRR